MSTADRVLQALQQYDIKQEGQNKWRCNSPLRPGSNSRGFTLTIDGPENGAYFDHVSHDKGSLYDLARHLSIAIPVTQVESTKRKYDGLNDYAKAHGLHAGILEYWNWREVIRENRPALLFSTRTGDRFRFIDGKSPVYKSEPGYVRCWYGLSDKIVRYLEKDKLLVICNGEISTIAAQTFNICAIAQTGGEKELMRSLIDELKGKVSHIEGLRVMVAMDCDKTGVKAGRAVSEQLREAGFNVRAIDLALGQGGDLADFVMLYSKDARQKLESLKDVSPLVTADERDFSFYSLDEILRLPPVRWLIKGVLPRGGLCMVFGPSGVGKSFYALGLAFDLAFEEPVIYVAAEGESGYGTRARALIKHHKKQPKDLTFVLGTVDLFDSEDMSEFKRMSAVYTPSLIVIDTLAMSTGTADENSARDMKVIIDGCKRLSRELESTILLVHHTNKEGREARGSGSLFAACETVIRITRSDDVLVVESQKSKDLRPFEPVYLREISIDLGVNEDGEAVNSLVLLPAAQVAGDDNMLTPLQQQLLGLVRHEPAASLREYGHICEKNAGVIHRALGSLEKRGYISIQNGSRSLTEAGEQMLRRIEGGEVIQGDSGVIHSESENLPSRFSDSGDSPNRGVMPSAQNGKNTESRESLNQLPLNEQLSGESPVNHLNHYQGGL